MQFQQKSRRNGMFYFFLQWQLNYHKINIHRVCNIWLTYQYLKFTIEPSNFLQISSFPQDYYTMRTTHSIVNSFTQRFLHKIQKSKSPTKIKWLSFERQMWKSIMKVKSWPGAKRVTFVLPSSVWVTKRLLKKPLRDLWVLRKGAFFYSWGMVFRSALILI